MGYASSAFKTCRPLRSTSENTATARIPISRQARMMRTAISPRLAIRILWNIFSIVCFCANFQAFFLLGATVPDGGVRDIFVGIV